MADPDVDQAHENEDRHRGGGRLDDLERLLRDVAQLTESTAFIGFRGFGSGGWFAECRYDGDDLAVDAPGPVEAVEELSAVLRTRMSNDAAMHRAKADQLQRRLGE